MGSKLLIQRLVCSVAVTTTLWLISSQAEEFRFTVLSDIHFNVYHGLDRAQFAELEGLAVDDWSSFFEALKQPFVAQGQDSNYALMVSALAAASDRLPETPFVLYPGDFLGHEWLANYNRLASQPLEENPEAFRDFTAKALQLMANEFEKAFPNSVVLPTPGNDDSFCGDYWIQPNGGFLSVFAGIWEPLLRDAVEPAGFRKSFKALGCFAADLPGMPGHRLLSLNSVLWSDSYCDSYFDPVKNNVDCCSCSDVGDAPGKMQFEWLEEQLASAAAEDRKVWLLMHIPPGLDSYKEKEADGKSAAANLWTEAFTARYLDVLHRYRDTIRQSFTGHTHTDDYRVDQVGSEPILFHKIVPAVSPVYGNNPAVQFYEADPGTGVLTNWQTHYLSLKRADGGVPTQSWAAEYDARENYGVEVFNAETVSGLFESMRQDPASARSAAYRLFYQVSAREIPPADLPVYTCAILNATFAAYHNCLTNHGLSAPLRMNSPAELRHRAGGEVSASRK